MPVLNRDYVVCQICGHQASALNRHLKPAHKLTSSEYMALYPDAHMRSEVCYENRSVAIALGRANNPTKGARKKVTCGTCQSVYEASKFVPLGYPCPSCREERTRLQAEQEDLYWASKIEGEEYVRCRGCSYRATNLTSHVQNAHPEWVGCYPGQMVAKVSPTRDKTALIGTKHSAETIAKMSRNAGRWNKGQTKETNLSMARISEKRKGHRTFLEKDQLLQFALANGKVSVTATMRGVGCGYALVLRECRRHGILVFSRRLKQTKCMEAVSEVLGCSFKQEWSSASFRNPSTGRKFKYDGYFEEFNLVVEFHGHQHYSFPSTYVKDFQGYFDLQSRDRDKENMAREAGMFYLVVREDEPYSDPLFIKDRLTDEGVRCPGVN